MSTKGKSKQQPAVIGQPGLLGAVFEPYDGHVFVFGSNLAGIHGGGAALTAHRKYGARMGCGVGLMPMGPDVTPTCYALPTKDKNVETHPLHVVKFYVEVFKHVARSRPGLVFFVTRIGCGLAGFTDREIAPLFRDCPENVELPPGWKELTDVNG